MLPPPSKSYIRPKGTEPFGGLTTRPGLIGPPPPEVTVTTQDKNDKINEYWRVAINENGNFTIETTRSKLGPYKYKLFNKDNVLSARLIGDAEAFTILCAPSDVRYIIGIPGQNLYLTYEAGAHPPLTFKPGDGSHPDVQRFDFIPIGEDVPVKVDV